MVTLSTMALFACLGAWWGWKAASVRLQTGTGPIWKRPADVGRRVHAHRVRRRRQLWRFGYTGSMDRAGRRLRLLGALAGRSARGISVQLHVKAALDLAPVIERSGCLDVVSSLRWTRFVCRL